MNTLSIVASTAAFDKNPQSKEREVTLDLGFSSFFVDFPEIFLVISCYNLLLLIVQVMLHSLKLSLVGLFWIFDYIRALKKGNCNNVIKKANCPSIYLLFVFWFEQQHGKEERRLEGIFRPNLVEECANFQNIETSKQKFQ